MIRYKLTDADGYTRRDSPNEQWWTPGETVFAFGDKPELCTDGVIHWYDSPLVAVLMNPVHAKIRNPRLWEIAVYEIAAHDGTKGGSLSATPIREIPIPTVTAEQRIKFGILCTMPVCKDRKWRKWARGWLSGADRSREAAYAAYTAIDPATSAASAAYAAYTAAYAHSADYAAHSAASAAKGRIGRIDLAAIARQACEEQQP